MKILTDIKNIFSKAPPQPVVTNEHVTHEPVLSEPAWRDIEAYMAKHEIEIEEEAKLFIEKYGSDFNSFLYRKELATIIRTNVLPFRQPDSKHNDFLDNSYWNKKHPFNFPGPFYTGESDSCGTGDIESPDNVMYDEYTMEFIFKQPQTFEEFLGVVDAAAVEVFDSYSCDGNNFWTYSKCREWWKGRIDMIWEINKNETKKRNGDRAGLYENYLKGEAKNDLQKYCYFLDNGTYPKSETTILPQLV